jgi:preprotein translocase subunit SecA
MAKFFSLEVNLWDKYKGTINLINQIGPELEHYSDSQLKQRSNQLKESCHTNKSKSFKKILNSKVLIESFALVREASRRTLGLRHYDTQLLGGLVLNDNKIAEMRTGEGKTLVATAPAFFNALGGRGVHIVTVNDYLAQRDAEWMGQIYRYLGLNIGLIQSSMQPEQRRKNYNRDITYVTNSELGFDFLKDNLVTDIDELVQRPFNYCIIDEVDSILIDEARTPLIISGPGKVELEKIIKATEIVKFLSKIKDFEVDEKAKNISLTTSGLLKIQKLLKVDSLYNLTEPWIPFILNALRAKVLYFKNVHYIQKNDQIIIVDEFTGRVMEGRRWADGLHNAIEAKEKIYNVEGSETTASITYQNFFRLYPKISGMTGTAKTEELEFEKIYNLCVAVLPTFKPIKRIDLIDLIYMDDINKWKAVARECKKMFKLGRPVLVGTTTIKNSELLSLLLKNYEVPHQLLNAKPENIKREAEIIAQAGCLFSITIATNMAGRGTDILLGGNPEYITYKQTIAFLKSIVNEYDTQTIEILKSVIQDYDNTNADLFASKAKIKNIINELTENRNQLLNLESDFKTLLSLITIPNKVLNKIENLVFKLYNIVLEKNKVEAKKEREKVIELGGLYVIGTELHESRRIDNQLRGRSGRQGDPGSSRFFLSLNDPLLKIFGGDNIKKFMQAFEISEEALESKFLAQALESAQQKVEGFYYDQRKTLNKYDRILDQQRYLIYKFRRKILFANTCRELLLELGQAFIDSCLSLLEKRTKQKRSIYQILCIFYTLNLSFETCINEDANLKNIKLLKSLLYEQFWSVYCLKELKFWLYDLVLLRYYEKLVMLKNIDIFWSRHLENITFLRDAVSWSAYAQKDPLLLYEEQATKLFNETFKQCRDSIIYNLLTVEIL